MRSLRSRLRVFSFTMALIFSFSFNQSVYAAVEEHAETEEWTSWEIAKWTVITGTSLFVVTKISKLCLRATGVIAAADDDLWDIYNPVNVAYMLVNLLRREAQSHGGPVHY